jgi:predicted ATPase
MSLPKVTPASFKAKKVIKICITGGPGSGRVTAMARLAFRLPEMGYRVISVPDAAVLLKEGGVNIDISSMNQTQVIEVQLRIIRLRMALEEIFTEIGERCGEKVVVICNSGVINGAAYVSKEAWQAVLDELGVTGVHLRDFRYDAVLHLVTAASNAERYYSSHKTGVSVEEARRIDKNLQEVYTGHPKFFIIGNDCATFEEKLQKVTDVAFKTLNIQSVRQFSYKLLVEVKDLDDEKIPIVPEYIKSQKIFVEETFIKSDEGMIVRVQKRGHSDSYNYLLTSEKTRDDGTNEISSQIISPRAYMNYLEQRDVTRNTVKRVLFCFIYEENYMILDTFFNSKFNGSLLRIESNKPLEEITVPEFVKTIRNVQNDPGYSTHKLAKKDWYESPGPKSG